MTKLERNVFGQVFGQLFGQLSPIPLSLAHTDSTNHSTQKDNFRRILEEKVISTQPPTVDYYIINRMWLFQQLGELPMLFGKVSQFILKKICNYQSQRIDLVFDRYESPSIKDSGRDL